MTHDGGTIEEIEAYLATLPKYTTTLLSRFDSRAGDSHTTADEACQSFPQKGERFGEDGRFEIIRSIGAGGMGLVFRAFDHKLERDAAIKFLQLSQEHREEQVKLLHQEAKAAAQLNHENIVGIFDLGAWGGQPFLVMEYIEGQTLDRAAAASRLSARRVIEIFVDVGRGLEHAHRNGVIHRDLKPSNIFIRLDGRAKILDFGTALFHKLTPGLATGELIGTPAYMAPEQWWGLAQDGRVDIWAVGVILYELLNGSHPFSGATPLAILRKVDSKEPSLSLDTRKLGLPEEVGHLVRRAMDKNPALRFQNAEELVDGLRDLERMLSTSRRSSMPSPARSVDAERRQLTFVSCTLSDLSALVDDIEPPEFRRITTLFSDIVGQAVEDYDGVVLVSSSGKILACFGYPTAQEDDACRAARAALRITDRANTPGSRLTLDDETPLTVQIAVHTGTVIIEGSISASPPTLIQGDAPGVAGWLADEAAPNTAIMSQTTEQIVRGFFATESLGSYARGSSSAPVEVFRLVEEIGRSSRFERSFATGLTPLIGRSSEQKALFLLWKGALEGVGHVLVVSGEAGIGKSRLVQGLKEHVLADPNARAVICQCWSHLSGSAFYPIIDMLLRSLRINRDDAASDRLAKVEAFLTSLDLDLADNVPMLASLLSIPLPIRYPRIELTPVLQRERTLSVLEAILLRISAQYPLLFMVEDLHWIDQSSLEVLTRLSARVANSRALFLFTCRPEFRSPWSELPHGRELRLERLTAENVAAMVEELAGARPLPPAIVDEIVTRTDGIPLFVEELTRLVVARLPENDSPAGSLLPRSIPVTLHDLLIARLDRLQAHDREVAQLSSVLGKSFAYRVLVACADGPLEAVNASISTLIDEGILERTGRSPDAPLRFRHALIQEAGYQSLLNTRRRKWHKRIAAVLTDAFPDIAAAQPEILAHHHFEARDIHQALAAFQQAAELAMARSANAEAVNHFSSALNAIQLLPPSVERDRLELKVQTAVGTPLMTIKGFAAAEVERAFARAHELCGQAPEGPVLFPVIRGLWYYYFMRADFRVAFKLANQMTTLGHELGDIDSELVGSRLLGATCFVTGRLDESLGHFERVMRAYQAGHDAHLVSLHGLHPRMGALSWILWGAWFAGYPDRSTAAEERLFALIDEVDHPHSSAFALGYAAAFHQYRREPEETRRVAEAAMSLCTEHRLSMWLAWSTFLHGSALVQLGDGDGLPEIERGIASWRGIGCNLGLAYALGLLAEALGKLRRVDEAHRAISEATSMSRAMNDCYYEPELMRIRGELLLLDGSAAEAEAQFRRGLELCRIRGARSLELRAALAVSRCMLSRGEPIAARTLLEPTYASFTEGLSTPDLSDARSLLAELR
jgi:TOMM system kinase/cyclase fusion protein